MPFCIPTRSVGVQQRILKKRDSSVASAHQLWLGSLFHQFERLSWAHALEGSEEPWQKFYHEGFGWKFSKSDAVFECYVIDTGQPGEQSINGGMLQHQQPLAKNNGVSGLCLYYLCRFHQPAASLVVPCQSKIEKWTTTEKDAHQHLVIVVPTSSAIN